MSLTPPLLDHAATKGSSRRSCAGTRSRRSLLTSQLEAQKRMREWAEATVRPSSPPPDGPPPDRPATDELEELRRKVEDLERRLRAERKSPRKKSSR